MDNNKRPSWEHTIETYNKPVRFFDKIDWTVFIATLFLVVFGIVVAVIIKSYG